MTRRNPVHARQVYRAMPAGVVTPLLVGRPDVVGTIGLADRMVLALVVNRIDRTAPDAYTAGSIGKPRTVLIDFRIGPHGRHKLKIGYHAADAPGDALFRNKTGLQSKGPDAGDKRDMPL